AIHLVRLSAPLTPLLCNSEDRKSMGSSNYLLRVTYPFPPSRKGSFASLTQKVKTFLDNNYQ
ncbi:hypothetical protein, partial [Sulfuracidifex metallicus]|uniref:hypothetical protein n=1 Tax=Sulfuracidifex metallicus TaxID=47303 RepID=UPI001C451AC0